MISSVKPIRTGFVITSMPVGGAETLLVNLFRRFDRNQVDPVLFCLKELGPLGEELAKDFDSEANLIRGKYDLTVLPRLASAFRNRKIDAVVTVGAGDKMFWGRLAAKVAGVRVICSALHSTGWPDGVGKLNRLLTPITDGFIAVAKPHGEFLVNFEKFPGKKVFVIPNGIDTDRFAPRSDSKSEFSSLTLREELGLTSDTQLIGIVAALRSEKNHDLFVDCAARTLKTFPDAHFVIVGDGPERSKIESRIAEHGIQNRVHLLGTRNDTPRVVASLDVFMLTSHNEANPVSILEALSCTVPVIATNVGSVKETVIPDSTGILIESGNVDQASQSLCSLLSNRELRHRLGQAGRKLVVENGSLEMMVSGYQDLIRKIYSAKSARRIARPSRESSAQIPSAEFRGKKKIAQT